MLQPGQLIDEKYRIVRLIGEGGMGAVYEAEHVFLERRVALKVLAPWMAGNPEAIRRFYREAKAAAKIGHENICEVTDVGQTAGGMPYIVMQLLQGRSLAAELARCGPLRIGRAIDIATQALGALSAAHAAGIVHRDMKPDNIFLTRAAGRDDFVKLLDFGISKMRTAATSGGIGLTQAGTVLGTPAYMAPEQARGETDIDARADVWAMGVVTYEMLVGKPPFEGANYNQVIYNVLAAPIPPPRSQRREVSAELDAAVMRALERDPGRRFATAEAFSDALQLAGLGVAEPASFPKAATPERGFEIAEEATTVAPHSAAPDAAPARAQFRGAPIPPVAERPPIPVAGPRSPAEATVSGRLATTTAGVPPTVWTRLRARPTAVASAAAVLVVVVVLAFVLAGRGTPEGGRPAAEGGTAGATAGVASVPALAGAPVRPATTETGAASGARSAPDAGAGGSVADAWSGGSATTTSPRPDVGAMLVAVAMPPRGPDVAVGFDASLAGRPQAGTAAPALRREGGGRSDRAASPRDAAAVAAPGDSGRPQATGTLTVTAVPGTEVFVDGEPAGRAPFAGRATAAGPHRLRLVNAALGVDREESILVQAGQETVIVRTAEQLRATAVVAAAPADGGTATPPAAADAGARRDIAIRREAGPAAVPAAADAGAGRGIVIRREAGSAAVSAATDAGAAVPPPVVGDGGRVRIRRDAGGPP